MSGGLAWPITRIMHRLFHAGRKSCHQPMSIPGWEKILSPAYVYSMLGESPAYVYSMLGEKPVTTLCLLWIQW